MYLLLEGMLGVGIKVGIRLSVLKLFRPFLLGQAGLEKQPLVSIVPGRFLELIHPLVCSVHFAFKIPGFREP